MLKVGDIAPAFSLPDSKGEAVTLAELLKNGPILLYFYPGDFTPVCTKQACMYRDNMANLSDVGVQVVGISRQGAGSKTRFAAAYQLGFKLLSDEIGTVIRAYGAWALGGFLIRRVSYLIESDGRISDRAASFFSLARQARFMEGVVLRGKAGVR